tara:strand:- start:328 stop:1044 length:717 start_codon:yes stop_codon:yes gene_type:complete
LSAFTLATLRTAIDEWLENTSWGNPSQRDSLIVLAEEKINSLVGIAGFNTDTASASVAAGDNNITPIPESITSPLNPLYLKMRSQVGTEADNPWSFLLLKDYNFLQEYAPVNNVESQSAPKYYSFYSDVSNSNQATVNFAPYADASYSYEFNYYFEPASITAGTADGTTWLSNHAKNALLYGSILQGYIFMKGEQQIIQTYEMKFIEAIKALVAMQGGTFRDTSFNDSDNAPNMMVAQ